jgi:VanZ family protein
LVVAGLLLAIAVLSGQPFSAQDLRGSLLRHDNLLQWVGSLPHLSFEYDGLVVDNRAHPAEFLQFWLRKGAHAALYGALGLALAWALGGMHGSRRGRAWALAGLLVAAVALADELHQRSIPGRTGRVVDVMVDVAGFVLVSLGAWSFITLRGWRRGARKSTAPLP